MGTLPAVKTEIKHVVHPEVELALNLPELPDLELLQVKKDDEILFAFVHAISEEEYIAAVAAVSARLVNCQFFLGDLINKGVARFGESIFEKLTKVAGKERKTLVDYARVARRVTPEARRDDLDFNHHRAVESLQTAGEQIHFLSLAAENDWSVDELKAEVVAARPGRPRANNKIISFSVGLSPEDADILRLIAEQRDIKPGDLLGEIVRDYLEAQAPWKADSIETPAVRTAEEVSASVAS